jgi:hypothetical protein
MEWAEQRAAETGAAEIASDSVEGAMHLIRTYRRQGYRVMGLVTWDLVNHSSVILSEYVVPTSIDEHRGGS